MKLHSLHCNVVILGGGPAGLATALSLRKHSPHLSVIVIERSAYERTRIGETLPPGTQVLLEQLDIWPAFVERDYVQSYGTCAAWGSNQLYTNEFIYGMHGQGWHVDRRDFDLMLSELVIQRDVSLYTRARLIDYRRHHDGWRLSVGALNSHQPSFLIDADFVVDATGRSAFFARAQGAQRRVFDRLVGAVMFFDAPAASSDSYTLVEASEHGWWYSALLPSGRLVVACMSDADLVKAQGLKSSECWLSCIDRTRYTRERLHGARPRTTPQIHPAYSHRLDRVSGDGWLAVGDAAYTFDPLSSQGIFQAIRGGIYASYAILDAFKQNTSGLKKYASLIDHEFSNYRNIWADYYKRERRWPQSAFWQRRGEQLLSQK